MADDLELIRIIDSYQAESKESKTHRLQLNEQNRDAYFAIEDYSYKLQGQSKEFLPKTSSSVEQFVSVLKNSLTQFGDWFSVELGESQTQSGIDGNTIRTLLTFFLNNLFVPPNKVKDFTTVISDATKTALLESIAIIKIYGHKTSQKEFDFDGDKLKTKTTKPWRLRIDLVPFEDYYPDPTGRGLYEIHESEIDLYELKKLAEAGVYDKQAVNSIEESFKAVSRVSSHERSATHKGQSPFKENKNRKTVTVREFWGTILDDEGNILHENVTMTDANGKFIIRKPSPNPYWHGESPFNIIPIITIPFSIYHKALYDDGVLLNKAVNELFNLMLDGGLAAVWGVKQLRPGLLLDPTQVQNGIPAATTLHIRDETPPGLAVLEQVITGTVPPDALRMFQIVEQEFNASVLTNDLKLGNLPPKQVRATEIVEASQSQAVTLNAILRDMEVVGIAPILKKALLLILQFADDLNSRDVISVIGSQSALILSRMSAAERFAQFAMKASFKVFGMSGTLSKVKDFQKITTILQLVFSNPVFAQLFTQKFDMGKVLDEVFRLINIDPNKFKPDQQAGGVQGANDILSQLLGGQSTSPQEGIQQNTEENQSQALGRIEGV